MIELLGIIVAFLVANYVPAIAVYIIGGLVYAILKWVFKAVMLRSDIVGLVDSKEAGTVEVQRARYASKHFGRSEYPPQVKNNKAKLFGWAAFWPINLIWTLIHDVAKNSWTWIYNKFGSVLQAMSDKILPK